MAKKRRQDGRFVTLKSGRVIFIPKGERTKWADVKGKMGARGPGGQGQVRQVTEADYPDQKWREARHGWKSQTDKLKAEIGKERKLTREERRDLRNINEMLFFVQDACKSESNHAFVIESDRGVEAIGALAGWVDKTGACEITHLATAPMNMQASKGRRRGYGTRVTQRMVRQALDNGATSILLDAASAAAETFYGKLGFERSRIHTGKRKMVLDEEGMRRLIDAEVR